MGCLNVTTKLLKTILDIKLSLFCTLNENAAISVNNSNVSLNAEGSSVNVNIFSNIDWIIE